ncbi:MAG TPA: methyltransferase domain-containing protein, partial [Nitrolancea sp.]|nr:methyltransferase domain-containing protein [Nitrolancea sp.]
RTLANSEAHRAATASAAPDIECEPLTSQLALAFQCPVCRSTMSRSDNDTLTCDAHQHTIQRIDGIWHALPDERASYFDLFIREYETIRRHEGRASHKAAFYEALPFEDLSGRYAADWHIRAVSFNALIARVVKPLEARLRRPLVALDLGAGNGWLSNRLAQRGHSVAGIDLLTNPTDGLGACRHYKTNLTPIQAEFDALPLRSKQADLIVFNGSLHYSTKFEATLREALRVLRDDGVLVILDSPIYWNAASGRAMVREREEHFAREVGFPSNALPMENYLTFRRLDELGETLGVRWDRHEPFYGLRWASRPWRARVRRHREPARFMLISGTRGSGVANSRRSIKRRSWRLLLTASRPWKQRRQRRTVLERVSGYPIVVLPQVFNPRLLRSGEFFAAKLDVELAGSGGSVLDLGTGSGVCAVVSARWACEVVAVDINPEAVRCARVNVMLNRVEDRVEVRQGDLFASVADERFDLVLFNPPYYRGTPRDLIDHAWRSTDVVSRFATELSAHLKSGGSALVILSTDGETDQFLATFGAHGLTVEPVARQDLINEVFTIYRLTDEGQAGHDHPL